MTEDALLNQPQTALAIFGAATATAMAINANIIAYSTTVTPLVFLFFCMMFSYKQILRTNLLPLWFTLKVGAGRMPPASASFQEESNDVVSYRMGSRPGESNEGVTCRQGSDI